MVETETVPIGAGVVLLRGELVSQADELLKFIYEIIARCPLRRVFTPRGKPMSVEMTNCGKFGWISDSFGYRYENVDPISRSGWPSMPEYFREVAEWCAARAGYWDFSPDACLINRYSTGSKMGLHQDRDEKDLSQPIVSVSLGLPATFFVGSKVRKVSISKVKLWHGDVVVLGGESRLAYHGVGALRAGNHPATGQYRFNLTFRRVMPAN